MDNELKISLQISIALHVLILVGIPAKRKAVMSIPLNVELLRFRSEAGGAINKQKEAEQVKPAEKKKDDGFNINKKETKKKIEAVSKTAKHESSSKSDGSQLFKAGSGMMLDTGDFPYAFYLKILQNKIASNWEWPEKSGSLKATVYFRISRNGSISNVDIYKTSGDYLYDQSAKRAVSISSPMTPLPEEYKENDLGVYFEFSYHE